MRMGLQSVPVEILERSTARNAIGQQVQTLTLWRRVWGSFTPFRGGELSLAGGVEHNPTAKFRFAYMDVQNPAGDGKSLHSNMVLRMPDSDLLWDVDVVHPDLATKRDVQVIAIGKRAAV